MQREETRKELNKGSWNDMLLYLMKDESYMN